MNNVDRLVRDTLLKGASVQSADYIASLRDEHALLTAQANHCIDMGELMEAGNYIGQMVDIEYLLEQATLG